MCSKNYGPSGMWNNGGYSECSKDSALNITNCEYIYSLYSSTTCYSCKKNYAVSESGNSCTSHTMDENCRQ